ncbi:TIGR02172 family protein [Prevotella sp. khp1]|uniref:TIGR02172 family protein n=1 Tax=Prevotellaceae TaxID=171552 RepID=UPI00088566FE|nr:MULTISPECIES: TIGR02172 family protein [Prevotellaceae]QVJ81079.1 TIGR02172 family protein [Xylanibacter ruminicola]SDQ08022.1 TIGR02172 family protein [Prevotella sp. khp1]
MNEDILRINLDDYIQTGEGGTALTYTHKDGLSLAKLYNPGFEADRAKAEFLTARAVFELGIPSPEPFRLITDGQRSGAEYELIKNKRSYTRIISQEPERLEEISLKFARMAKELHAKQADTTRLQSYKQRIANFYHEKDMVPEDYKQRVLQFLDTVPDTPRCLHGDLHIGNIITDGQRDLWIDLGEFAYGAPEWDLALLWTMCHNMPGDRVEHIFHITHDTMMAHWDIFFPAYLGTSDPQAIHEATQRLLPYYAAKVPYIFHMVFNRPMPDAALQNIGKYL